MSLKQTLNKAKKNIKKAYREITGDRLYNYDDKESREETIPYLLLYAKGQREPFQKGWVLYNNYYNNNHVVQQELYAYCQENNIPWVPAIIPDPYIHVESQIQPQIPDFEFSGRDDDMDSQKAKIRQYVVQYILDNNDMTVKNSRNERRLNKLGNAIWKVGYDDNMQYSTGSVDKYHGDIFVHDIDPANIFPDPVAIDVDDCEFIDYVYRLHRMKAARVFAKQLEKLQITVEELSSGVATAETRIYNTQVYDVSDDTVEIIEHWFRQPKDGSETYEYEVDGKTIKQTVTWEAGDIACSILINDTEIKYIPLYWMKTSKQNKMYPFTKSCKIPMENQFWDKSEIEPIKELVDAADRELAINILNDTFTANDIIVIGENSISDNCEIENKPGAIWRIKDGYTPPIRMGGLGNLNGGLKDTINFIRDIIKQTVGNFDINMGDAPPSNVKTLGGLVELKDQGNKRQNIKKADRTAGFERLYKLIDYTALEFYDDNRLIFLGAKGEQQTEQPINNMDRSKGAVSFKYNSDNMRVLDADQTDQTGEVTYYYPVVDAKIFVGDGVVDSKSMTIQATEMLAGMNITLENYKIVESLVDIMQLPDRKAIKDSIEQYFSNQMQLPFLLKDMPRIQIAYADLAPDAQIQLLNQMGIQTNGGLTNELQVEQQKNQLQQPLQQPQQMDYSKLFEGLSPEELNHLSQNPQLLEEVIKQMQGGQQNGQMP